MLSYLKSGRLSLNPSTVCARQKPKTDTPIVSSAWVARLRPLFGAQTPCLADIPALRITIVRCRRTWPNGRRSSNQPPRSHTVDPGRHV